MPRLSAIFRASALTSTAAASAICLAVTPDALADSLTFTNYTTSSGLGGNTVNGVYASGTTAYAATSGGLSIAQLPSQSVPGPLPVIGAGAAFGWSRRLRRRLRHNTCAAVPPT